MTTSRAAIAARWWSASDSGSGGPLSALARGAITRTPTGHHAVDRRVGWGWQASTCDRAIMSRFPPLHRVARSALLAGQAAPSAWSPPVLWVVPGGMTERMTGALPSTGRHQGVPCLTTPIDYGWVVRGSPQSQRP